jgi:hypothetical protein
METVTIDGVEYVKASVLAKKHKYTTDYIGQLCRAKKVDAHLVGRTWYVYPPTLEAHKTTRYSDLRSDEKTNKTKIDRAFSREPIPVLPKPQPAHKTTSNFEQRIFWKPLRYEDDQTELLPAVEKATTEEIKPATLAVELADASRVPVRQKSDNVRMQGQPLPAVALRGTLKVLDFSPEFPGDSSEYQDTASDFVNDAPGSLSPAPTLSRSDHSHLKQGSDKEILDEREANPRVSSFEQRLRAQTLDHDAARTSDILTPKVVEAHPLVPLHTPRSFPLIVSASTLLVVCLGLGMVMLSLESTVIADAGQQVAQVSLDWNFLPRLISRFGF